MAGLQTRILTIALLAAMVLAACYPALVLASASTPEWTAEPMHRVVTPQATTGQIVYYPADIKAAYGLPLTGGSGTIAIIDAYDDSHVASDLNYFSSYNNLATPNLEIHKMSSFISGSTSWGVEISLDVEWAHAIAPTAKILLVEARSSSLGDLLSAVSYASSRSDVVAVSMSWGAAEFSSETAYDSYFTNTNGVTFYASSGDTGGQIIWPSSSVNVVSVGGTTLTKTSGVFTEAAWSGSGGGVSAYEPSPAFQTGLGYTNRATPDVSYNADPNTGFFVYDTYGYNGGLIVGGTSAGAPQWAAIQALGGTASDKNLYAIYNSPAYASDFRDITSGQAGSYQTGPGYDLVTGIGSPLTTSFTPTPVADFTISSSPNTVALNTATSNPATITITVVALNGFSGQVTLSATTTSSLTTAFSTNPISGSGTSTLTITAPAGTSAGTYTVTVLGTSGTTVHTTAISVQVTVPDFSLTATPASQNIKAGGTGTAKVTVNSQNNYAGSVSLTASAPTGVKISFGPTTPIAAGNSVTITITLPNNARGTYTITITGTDSVNKALSHKTTVSVTVSNR